MDDNKVRVNLRWGGKVLHDGDSMRYSRRPIVIQLFPLSLKYDHLKRLFTSKMNITNPEDDVVISSRYPNYFTSNGQAIFGETLVWNDYSLFLFFCIIEIFGNRLNLQILGMYECVKHFSIF